MGTPKTSAPDLDRKLKELVEKLKKEDNWPPKSKTKGGLSGLNYLRDQLKVGFKQLRESVTRLGYIDLFHKGTQTKAQAKAKEKLRVLVATGDYPQSLDEIGKIVGIDTSVNRETARQLLGKWMKDLGVSWASKWDTDNWSDAEWKSWENDQLGELEGKSKSGTGSRTYETKTNIPFEQRFRESDKIDQKRYLDAIRNHDYKEYQASRHQIWQKHHRLQKAMLADVAGKKPFEAVIDGLSPEQIEKVVIRRGKRNFQGFLKRAQVESWETIDGSEKGKERPGTRKVVGSLVVATPNELVKMEQLAIQMVRDQVDAYQRTGTMPKVNHLDHIFPHGSPRIINGTVYGQGAIDNLGRFQGYGLTTIQNIRDVAASDNMRRHNVFGQEELDELLRRERLSGEAGKNVVSVEESVRQDALLSEDQRRAKSDKALKGHLGGKTVPFRYGGTALNWLPYGIGSLLTLGFSALPGVSEANTVKGRMRENLTDPYFLADVFTGVDSRRFEEDYNKGLLDVTGQTFGERWGESADWWKKKLNIWD